MKKILIILIVLTQNTFSQEITLKWAEKIPTKGSASILGGKNGNYYTTHPNRENELVGRTYDSNLSLINEKNINFNLDEKKYSYHGAYFLNKSILHFIEDTKRKEDKKFIYAGFSDFDLVTSDKLNIIDQAKDDKKLIEFGLRSISPDSTKVLIYHENTTKRNEPNILSYKIYNSEITDVINEGKVSLPIKAKSYTTKEVRVDNIGNMYVLARIDKDKKDREKKQSDYFYKLIVFGKNDLVKEFDFEYPNNDISHFDIIAGQNNTFFCTGFLNSLDVKGSKKLISDEMFFATIDCKTLSLGESKMIKVPGLYPEEVKKRADLVPYKIRQIYQKKNGGFSIVAEQYKLITRTSCNTYGCNTIYLFYYCDIACIQTDNKMDVKSVSRTPKYQLNAGNPSITSTFKNDTTYIIYEDLTKNINAGSDKETKRSTRKLLASNTKNSLFILTVMSNGETKKEEIYNYKESKIRPDIFASREISPGEILLNANDQIGLLKIGQ